MSLLILIGRTSGLQFQYEQISFHYGDLNIYKSLVNLSVWYVSQERNLLEKMEKQNALSIKQFLCTP